MKYCWPEVDRTACVEEKVKLEQGFLGGDEESAKTEEAAIRVVQTPTASDVDEGVGLPDEGTIRNNGG